MSEVQAGYMEVAEPGLQKLHEQFLDRRFLNPHVTARGVAALVREGKANKEIAYSHACFP